MCQSSWVATLGTGLLSLFPQKPGGLTMHASPVQTKQSSGGQGEGSLFRTRQRPLKKERGNGAKLLSESTASFETHQDTFKPS